MTKVSFDLTCQQELRKADSSNEIKSDILKTKPYDQALGSKHNQSVNDGGIFETGRRALVFAIRSCNRTNSITGAGY